MESSSQREYTFDLAFFGELTFDMPLGKSKSPLVIIPYSNGQISRNYEDKINSSDFSFGGDAKISIGNGMNLDLTFNPDFSQVEVDDQIINLTRFEVNLPEKRQLYKIMTYLPSVTLETLEHFFQEELVLLKISMEIQ